MKVSVCIPTFNQVNFIEQAILSALNQSLKPFEVIVFDDCSTDGTADILKKLALEIPTLKVFTQPHNMGIARNVDACLRAAVGDYVIRLDSDDFLSPGYTENLVHLLADNPDAGYAHACIQEVDQFGNNLKERRLARKSGYQNSNDALKAAAKGFKVAANILMFKKKALEKVGYIAADTNFAEDYYLVSSISANGFGNVFLNDVLANYRVWVDTGNVRQRRKLDEIIGFRKVFDEVLLPAYQSRGWGINILNKYKTNFVCRHSDCLAWSVYTPSEKEELKKELFSLSSSVKGRICVWLNANKMGWLLSDYEKIKDSAKSIVKSFIRRY
jgi:glycosyltransferase involved in cell wall biosynthesis